MSAALEVTIESPELEQLRRRLERLAGALGDTRPLLEALGAGVESQTRRRIAQEKESPAGKPWPEWSDLYGATRHAGQSLLQSEGDLLDSIQQALDGGEAAVGTPLVYGAAQQFGRDEIDLPEREFLGISTANLTELDALLDGFVDDLAAEALA